MNLIEELTTFSKELASLKIIEDESTRREVFQSIIILAIKSNPLPAAFLHHKFFCLCAE